MSADSWTHCPRCQKERAVRATERTEFREDYEIYGAEDGTVTVTYSGSCYSCNLSVKFTYEHPIEGVS